MARSVERLTLKSLCHEMKIAPTLARDRLRTAARQPKRFPALAKAHKPRQPWEWLRGSGAEKEARTVLASQKPEL